MDEVVLVEILQATGHVHELRRESVNVVKYEVQYTNEAERILIRILLQKTHDISILHPYRDHREGWWYRGNANER